MLMRTVACLSLLALSSLATAETTWQRNADWLKGQVDECAHAFDLHGCRTFAARALERLFGIPHLCPQSSCITAGQLAATITKGTGWSALGAATEQAVLTRAQEMAIGGLPVVAVHDASGWVVLVMPGALYPSVRWRRNVPASVGTRPDQPDASIYGKGLNFLFSDPATVTLYVHK